MPLAHQCSIGRSERFAPRSKAECVQGPPFPKVDLVGQPMGGLQTRPQRRRGKSSAERNEDRLYLLKLVDRDVVNRRGDDFETKVFVQGFHG